MLRISVSNWRTTDEDVDRTLEAVRRVSQMSVQGKSLNNSATFSMKLRTG